MECLCMSTREMYWHDEATVIVLMREGLQTVGKYDVQHALCYCLCCSCGSAEQTIILSFQLQHGWVEAPCPHVNSVQCWAAAAACGQ